MNIIAKWPYGSFSFHFGLKDMFDLFNELDALDDPSPAVVRRLPDRLTFTQPHFEPSTGDLLQKELNDDEWKLTLFRLSDVTVEDVWNEAKVIRGWEMDETFGHYVERTDNIRGPINLKPPYRNE